jgi:YegS C-terminal NAD kinase beta sandwich-like domain
VRIALIANAASGGGFDPEPLAATIRRHGADVRVYARGDLDGVLDVTVLPAGSRLALARRAWGLRRGTIAEQRDVCHARGHVIEVDLPAGTELNVDGELLDDGMQRVTVERAAFALVAG